MLLYKHLYCLVLSLSRALSLSVIDHLCVLLQTAWGVRPSCRAAHDARVRLPRRRGFPAARVRVHCRSLHQGAAPRSDFTASCARSHARTLARTLALSCMHTCMHERTHAHDPRTLRTHIPTQRTHTSRAQLRAINSDSSDRQLRGMLPLMTLPDRRFRVSCRTLCSNPASARSGPSSGPTPRPTASTTASSSRTSAASQSAQNERLCT